MKIGLLLPTTFAVGSPFNGIREQALHQASALMALGHTVILMTPWEKYDLDSFDVFQFFQGGPAFHEIEKRTVATKAKLVFAPIIDTMTPNWQYRISERIGRLHPKISTVQSAFSEQAAKSHLVIARSTYEKSKLIRGLGVNPEKIHIVLNGCPKPESADPQLARNEFSISDDFVLHISKFSNTNKNVLNMIKAIGPMGLTLVIAGTSSPGNYLDKIKTEASKYSNVRILDRVSDEMRNSLYAACKVFCLPSHREGTGLVAVEAASFGANIVITSKGGPPDYFNSYADYVDDTSVEAISAAVSRAFSREPNPDLKEHALEKLTWEQSAKHLVELYSQ